eukprot:1155735-Pelagomonas_calceolata.AAC.4
MHAGKCYRDQAGEGAVAGMPSLPALKAEVDDRGVHSQVPGVEDEKYAAFAMKPSEHRDRSSPGSLST